MRLLNLLTILLLTTQCTSSFAKKTPVLSIIIDDIGYNYTDFKALSLPKEITFSILPFTPQSKLIAKKAHQQGRNLLVHMPMEAKSNNEKLGKGALMLAMPEKIFKKTLRRALNFIPEAQGLNNHMGSALTERYPPMRWTMEVLKARGLYFLDSRTSIHTIAESTAKLLDTPTLKRHVFLDNIKTEQAMNKQFQLALHLAQYNDAVVVIAHPYPETLRFLKQKLKTRPVKFKLLTLNKIFSKAQRLAMAKKKSEFQQANNRSTTKPLSQIQ